MNNLQQYNKELREKNIKITTKTTNNDKTIIKRRKQYKIEKDIIILDSEDRDKHIYPDPNNFVLTTLEELKNVLALRILKTEYLLTDASFNIITINDQVVPIQLYKNVHAYLYLNGYNKIKIASKLTTPIFTQLSPGINNYPVSIDDFRMDPCTYRLNPIEKKLNKFDIRLLDNKGEIVKISNPEKIQIILTLIVYRLV
tara:strand:- start:799 stop:1395 length:597 start_codon:yes stop_codon:yes gene_type:complete